MIELKDDDPTALEALLRHIYTFDYIDDQEKRKDDWMFHIHYSIVARSVEQRSWYHSLTH